MKLSFDSNSISTMNKGQQVGSMIGALAGTYYAFSNKKSFWGYVGFIVLIVRCFRSERSSTPVREKIQRK